MGGKPARFRGFSVPTCCSYQAEAPGRSYLDNAVSRPLPRAVAAFEYSRTL
jgi:hypothetical protein